MKNFKLTKKNVICLVLIVLAIVNSVFLAKYTSALHANASKAIAKWNVNSISNSSNTINLVSGDTPQSYTLNVTSTSEVTASYYVVLSHVPSELEVKIDGRDYQTPNASGVITFDNVGSFTANDVNNTTSHTITFNAPLDSTIPDTNNVKIDVVFSQED